MDVVAGENGNFPFVEDLDGEQGDYDGVIQKLERNICKSFGLREVGGRATIPQAKSLSDALQKNTSVEKFLADLEFCPLPVTGLFVDYVRSNSRLKEIFVDYDIYYYVYDDSEETQQFYDEQLDCLYRAVLENPSIQTLKAASFGGPKSIYDLLANTKSLKEFHMFERHLSTAIAWSISAGMSRNPSIKKVVVGLSSVACLEILLSGFGLSSVESLTFSYDDTNSRLRDAISKLIFLTPSLKELLIKDFSASDTEGYISNIFLDLRHRACIDLKTLHLQSVLLAANVDNAALDSNVHIEEANSKLQNLFLTGVRFKSPRAVRLLWNVVGLQELIIDSPSYVSSPTSTAHKSLLLEFWAEFVRRNKSIASLTLKVGTDRTFLNGALEGARKTSLENLSIISGWAGVAVEIKRDTGTRLSRLLQEKTSNLKELHFEKSRLGREYITCLVAGVCHNRSLQILRCVNCSIESDSMTEILESMVVNETLKELSFKDLDISEPIRGLGQTLAEVFQGNKALVKLVVSRIDLRAGAMSESLAGLQGTKSLKTLIFDKCRLDNAGMASLVQTLESTSNGLVEIGIPKNATAGEDDDLKEGMWAVLEGLVRMPNIRKVFFGDAMADFTYGALALMLQAATENKNLIVLDGCAPSQHNVSLVMADITYNLKLNRFGRRILDSPNVVDGIWPRILSGITTNLEDADALFFFLREYFSRRNDKDYEQQKQPPQKRARVA